MLTIESIRAPGSVSGFKGVSLDHGGSHRPKPYRAYHGSQPNGNKEWRGPRRATAEEAAQDYCDRLNGLSAQPPQPTLKSAGHKRTKPKRKRVPMSKREQEARKVVAEETAKRKAKQGSRGYVYLAAEVPPQNQPNLQSLFDQSIGTYAVKIGWTDDEDERVRGLQTGNPRPLTILATLPGTKDDERALHAKYIKHNVQQEWFRPTREILSEFGLTAAVWGTDRLYLNQKED